MSFVSRCPAEEVEEVAAEEVEEVAAAAGSRWPGAVMQACLLDTRSRACCLLPRMSSLHQLSSR